MSASECLSMRVHIQVYGGGSTVPFVKRVTSVCRSCTCPSVHHKSQAILSGMCGEPSDMGTSFFPEYLALSLPFSFHSI